MESERLAALKTLLSTATDDEVIHMHDAVRREFVARAQREKALYPPMPTPVAPDSATPVHITVTRRKVPIGKGPNIERWEKNQQRMSEKTATTLFGNTHNPED